MSVEMSVAQPHWPREPQTLDKWVVGLIGAGGAAMLMGNIVIVCNRTYRPIKFNSVPLTLLSSLGGLIWIFAALVANDHFERRKGTVLAVCALWTYWFQVCGSALWLNCLTARLFVLFQIFIRKSDSPTYYRFLIALLVPAVGFCIAATRVDQLQYTLAPTPSSGVEAVADCQFQHNASMAYGLIALLLIYFLIFLGFAFKLRNAMAQFNEFRLIRRGGILSLFLFLLSLVTIQTHAYYTPVGRCLLSSAVASAIFYYFWARNGDVIYNVLFNQADYLDKFNKDLKRSPSQHERDKFSAGFLKMEAQLREVRAEVERHQDEIRQLQDEVKALEQEYAAMQQMTSAHSSPNGREIISPNGLEMISKGSR